MVHDPRHESLDTQNKKDIGSGGSDRNKLERNYLFFYLKVYI